MNRTSGTHSIPRSGTMLPYVALFLLAVASRMASTIYYIEDPDSLRFALGVVDYDVILLQPHFPGYPVFCFCVKIFYLLFGSYALAFSAVGGISVFIIIISLLRMLRAPLRSLEGVMVAVVIFANPFIWLMSNRYMPDLMGAACTFAALSLLLFGKEKQRFGEESIDMADLDGRTDHAKAQRRKEMHLLRVFAPLRDCNPVAAGMFLSGLLMGIRLSYAPFLILPLVIAAIRDRRKVVLHGAMFLTGILVWLIPLIAITGWNELLTAAQTQTSGHFEDFGGTVYTEPLFGLRLMKMAENIMADGLGGFQKGRHGITVIITAGLALTFTAGAAVMIWKHRNSGSWRAALGGLGAYLLWILFFQNVIYQSRHVLPAVMFLLIPVAIGCATFLRRAPATGKVFVMIFLAAYGTLAGVMVMQHREPTAVAQAKEYVEKSEGADLYIASVPLINYFVASQGVEASFISVHDPEQRKLLARLPENARLITIGEYQSLTGRTPRQERIFYHNPFVNSVWPRVVVHEY